MTQVESSDRIAIDVKSHRLLQTLLSENPKLARIMQDSVTGDEALEGVRDWVLEELKESPRALAYYRGEDTGREPFDALEWKDVAAIRLLDYADNAGREFVDLNLRGQAFVSDPIRQIWLAAKTGKGGVKPAFFQDMLHLFRQLSGVVGRAVPARAKVEEWMQRYPSGLDPDVAALQAENKERILNILIDRIDSGEIKSPRFRFEPGMSRHDKMQTALGWWGDSRFHLVFAVRSPELLNEMLDNTLAPDTMEVLFQAKEAGIPFFVNPYYLSLLHVRVPDFAPTADLAIRCYVIYSRQLVEEFGHIVAWEKEDLVEPGKANAAGWLLPPYDNVHRRYPDVAILIPDTAGRACSGLCAPCQRMYDFQRGRLNFDLDELNPTESWPEKLDQLMAYFRDDPQLRDILITGGDALMSTDKSLERILDAVYEMAVAKQTANQNRPDGEKFAEMSRVRLGSRIPVYLPQRVTDKLADVLARFREKGRKVGIEQFVVQTHFQSPLEVTAESREAIRKLLDAGWLVTNQHVTTVASSRRGHIARLRQVLGQIGVLPYYSFVTKGYQENQALYAPLSRSVQEEQEEKTLGLLRPEFKAQVEEMAADPASIPDRIEALQKDRRLPFLSTDRNVLNLPAVGKSLTFRTIGLTRDGRRVLEFDHDHTRAHSPIIDRMGKVVVVESKSISMFMQDLADMGEDLSEYADLWGYSIGETEPRASIYEYPDYGFKVTDRNPNYREE